MSKDSLHSTEAESLAGKLRALTSDPNYKDTVGAWIKEYRDEAIIEMARPTDVALIHQAQGKFQAYDAILKLISYRIQQGDEATRKRLKKLSNLNPNGDSQ